MKKVLGLVFILTLFLFSNAYAEKKKWRMNWKPHVGMTHIQLKNMWDDSVGMFFSNPYNWQIQSGGSWIEFKPDTNQDALTEAINKSYQDVDKMFNRYNNNNIVKVKIVNRPQIYNFKRSNAYWKLYKIDNGMSASQNNTQSESGSFTTAIGIHSDTCAELGFKRGTEKFGDCVLKLVELDVKRQSQQTGNVQIVQQFERERRDNSPELLIGLGLSLLSQSTTQQPVQLPQRTRCYFRTYGLECN